MERLLHPIADLPHKLGVSRSTLYNLFAAGAIKTVKIGRRTFVTDDELQRFVASLNETSAK